MKLAGDKEKFDDEWRYHRDWEKNFYCVIQVAISLGDELRSADPS